MTVIRFLTAGESHGKALVAIVEGMVAGLALDEEYINNQLSRRQGGYGRSSRMKLEQDKADIVSGVYDGQTLGSPISLMIPNKDWRKEWQEVTRPRPGHADLAGIAKYGLADIRPILERASARETAARVAVGAICRRFLEEFDVAIHSHTVAIGGHRVDGAIVPDWARVEASPLRCSDPDAEGRMVRAIDEAGAAGDTLGGVFEVVATGLPAGLGSHVHWDRRLGSQIAQAAMSIQAVKGVEIGAGFAAAELRGSRAQDAIGPRLWDRKSNFAGGIEGGVTNGQPVVVRGAVKPVPTVARPLPSVDIVSGEAVVGHHERSDVCVVPSAGVIAEAMLAIVVAAAVLEKFGGDHLKETQRNHSAYMRSLPGMTVHPPC
ncbi:MAG: chorismate synthase [Chloroflexota bacterium]